MNPDVVSAIARLRAMNVLSGGQAALFERVARRQLVSVRLEVRVLLYVGVLLLASGAGLLVAEHHRQIGPLAVAVAIGLAIAASLFWVVRKAPAFSWREVEPPNVAFDYILLLGLLLLASELAYVEVQFTVLGPKWAYHLLAVAAVYLLAAYRWDSRIVLGLALTTLAAWRGVSLSLISGSLHRSSAASVRAVPSHPEQHPVPPGVAAGHRGARAHLRGSSPDARAMRPDSVAWERAAEVHEAAGGWRRVGAIDEPTDQAIRQAFPDPCITPSAVWRVLAAAALAAVILCTFGALSIAFRPDTTALQVLLFLYAGACLIATDVLEGSPRSARRGVAGATSLLGVAFLLIGLGLFLTETVKMRYDDAIDGLLIASVLAWDLGCWRWGSPLFAALSTISLFLFLGRLPNARALWVLAGAVLVATAARRLDAARWAPSHRRGAAVIVVAGLVATYAALNAYSLDEHLLEQLRRFGPSATVPPRGLFIPAASATAVVPVAVLMWGLRSRRTFVLDTGIVLLALSLVTLRHYVHLAPLWAVLTLSGALLLVLGLAVERALRRAPAGDIAGFTADPLFSDERRQRALQIVPAVAAFTPAPSAPAEEKGFEGEGGRFGGGGATEKF